MRLIDADALIEDIKTKLWDWDTVDGITSSTVLKQTITDIDNAPTIDAVPVVRCKDCFLYGECEAAKWYGDYGYCSVGEMEDDDKSCDTCKYYDDDWCSGACDGCTRNQSYWERKDEEGE